ncbi:MAG: Ku protein [Limnobacter sp.]|nr:Ku protein [Limnobacter sp.]
MAIRALWKGAINFGLVHIPVSLHAASEDSGIDFDWLDRRSLDPVGYKRINKRTGREIDRKHIVKGVAYEKDKYVVLEDDEIAEAFPKSTQSIDIETFVEASEIPFVYLERPYYLAPNGNSKKVYALLRETLLDTGRIGLARVVIHTRQHLAALVPSGPALVLNLLRWGDEVRSFEGLDLPPEGTKAAGLSQKELSMAAKLVEDMSTKFEPAEYRDSFADRIMELVERKAKAGDAERVQPVEEAPAEGRGAEIIDLTELLQRSLAGGKAGSSGSRSGTKRPAAESSGRGKAKSSGNASEAKDAKRASSATSKRKSKTASTRKGAAARKSAARRSADSPRRANAA